MNTDRPASDTLDLMLVTDTLFDTNGVSRFIRDLGAHAAACNSALTVVTSSPLAPEQLPPHVLNLRPVLSVRMPFYKEQRLNLIPPFFALWRIIRNRRPAMLHLSTPGPMGWSARLIAAIEGIPCAGTYHTDFPHILEHNTGSKTMKAVTEWVMRRFYRRLRFVFSRSKAFVPLLLRDIAIAPERCFYLPPGTDTRRFSPGMASGRHFWEGYGIAPESLVLLYVGRLNVEKNLLFLIERYRDLRRSSAKEIALVLVGEGEYSQLTPQWRAEGIFHLGVKHGDELSRIYAGSDLFVSASITETLGQTVMEAQASGLPAVVADRGGVLETVINGQTGYTLDVAAPETWVATLTRLVEDDALRRRMGAAAHGQMQNASITKSCEAFFARHRSEAASLRRAKRP